MSRFTIKETSGPHTSGTKFYRVYTVECTDSTVGFVVTHWGKSRRGFVTPKVGGNTQVFEERASAVAWERGRKLTSKGKMHGTGLERGRYDFGPEQTVFSSGDSDEFFTALHQHFKNDVAERIYTTMMANFDREVQEVRDRLHEAALERTRIKEESELAQIKAEAEVVKHADWGSW